MTWSEMVASDNVLVWAAGLAGAAEGQAKPCCRVPRLPRIHPERKVTWEDITSSGWLS